MASSSLWQRFQQYFLRYDDVDFSIDISRMKFGDDFFDKMRPKIDKAFAAMRELEAGAIANPDENRMVGHYWLRNPALAPNPDLRRDIEETNKHIKAFAADVHSGKIVAANGKKFEHVLLIGIGGSALGPQFVAEALGSSADPMDIYFLDNTDPDGFDRTFAKIDNLLSQTLAIVISKSGGTKETRNGMLEAEAKFKAKGIPFGKHAIAVTGEASNLDKYAARDDRTRAHDATLKAAMLLALMWHYAGNGKGEKDMVILPYKDRLALFSKYLQQLVMESLGKEKDLQGNVVHQGIAVYGNKGSTDQHAYVQQLRDGVLNFFVTFIEVGKDREGAPFEVEPGFTSGDYLQGFLRGTRSALYDSGRESITLDRKST